MPCRYEGPLPISDKSRKELDRLTKENDSLRELVLRLMNDSNAYISDSEMNMILKDQLQHRKEDLARLKKTFLKSKDALRLGKVMLADPKKPLEPQLGFNPDDF